jgi:uncharacterized protein with von Willebrand factor type A (vWA) domain
LEKALIDFAGRLRSAGIQVSTAETVEAGRVVELVGLEDRETFKDALRSVLIKRSGDAPLYDALFDLFFTGGPRPAASPDDKSDQPSEDLGDALAELIDLHRPDLSLSAEMVMTGQFGALFRMILQRGQGVGLDRMESPLQSGFFLRRFREAMDVEGIRREAESFLAELEAGGVDPELVHGFRDYVTGNLAGLDEEMKALVGREAAGNRFQFVRRMEEEGHFDRPLTNLGPHEIAAMRAAVDRLARRLKERLSRRYKKYEAGRLDVKATMRRNVGLGGPLPYPCFRRRKNARPQVVALCDVSNSVRNYSRFMLLFLYTLKEVVSKVRSFIFVGDLAEVTGLFQRRSLDEAVAMAASAHGLTYVFRTDYGSVLKQFAEERLAAVDSRTTVFVIGDARNNYYDPHPEAMAAIAEKAKRTIWLNPEPRANWRMGDCVMGVYEPYCTKAAECGNLRQLSGIIEENLLP